MLKLAFWTISIAILGSVLLLPGTANADPRRVYTIADIAVDETADTTIAAQEQAFAAARIIGARRLVEKITLPEDRATAGGISIDLETANRLAAAVDIVEEARGGGTYRGKLTVVFNPQQVRSYLDGLGVPYVDRQAPMAVLAVDEGSALAQILPEEDLFAISPFKLAIIPGGADPDLDYSGIQSELEARRVILASAAFEGGPIDVILWTPESTVGLDQISAQLIPTQQGNSLRRRLDTLWKQQSVVRSTSRTLVKSTVRFGSINDWVSLRSALSRSPLVSQFNVDALASDGAIVNFAFAGDIDRLRRDLQQRGIAIDEAANGWTIRKVGFVIEAPQIGADENVTNTSETEDDEFLGFLSTEPGAVSDGQ